MSETNRCGTKRVWSIQWEVRCLDRGTFPIAFRIPSPTSVSRTSPGTRLVVGLLGLGLTAAGLGIWFQWQQTRRCLEFYGVEAAARISRAPRVELWSLKPLADHGHTGRLAATQRREISTAKGLVHLRRGLVEDANFMWSKPPGGDQPLPDAAWDVALVFKDDSGERGIVLAVALGSDAEPAQVTVLGQPGRVGLGKMAKGLRAWVAATMAASAADH